MEAKAHLRYRYILMVFVALIKTKTVLGDTPADCSYDDIVGNWVFQIGQDGFDNDIDCSNFENGDSKLHISIDIPEI